MGSGIWFKNIIRKKKVKVDGSDKNSQAMYSPSGKSNHEKSKVRSRRGDSASTDGVFKESHALSDDVADQNIAAIRIQTAFRAYMARRTFRRMRGMARLRTLVERDTVKKQASNTSSHLHSWSRIQEQIRGRRACMVIEGRLRQKKQENHLKFEAKIHDLEVDWSGGSKTKDEALARIQQREEAAVRRERAMAYAFSHQWRANSNPSFGSGNYEISKENWGWSWMDRWIDARPWESRVPGSPSPKRVQSNKTQKKVTSPASKGQVKAKLPSPNGNATRKPQKLSFETAEKTAAQKVNLKAEDDMTMNEQGAS